MEIRPLGAKLFLVGGRIDKHYGEAKGRFSQFHERVYVI